MFVMITAWDVMGTLHITARIVEDEHEAEALHVAFTANSTVPLPRHSLGLRDVVALIGEELINVAHDSSPLL